ncbi:MAG TPA: hypothetical protein PKY82_09375 [Pyrinomonadaceae bacterium]|nr:hypothetical protein [Pyrinomonadaceae bacterium]
MKKRSLILASMLILTTALSVLADGETGTSNLTFIDQVLTALGMN